MPRVKVGTLRAGRPSPAMFSHLMFFDAQPVGELNPFRVVGGEL